MTNYIYSAFTKIVYILIVLALWSLFVEDHAFVFAHAIRWFASQSFYSALPREVFEFIWDTLLVFSTFEMAMWIFAPGASDKSGSGDVDKGVSTGFTTRSMYS